MAEEFVVGGAGVEEPVFAEVLEASVALEELPDLARVEAWASSALAIWAEDPDAHEIDREFVAWLRSSTDPRAAVLLTAVERLLWPAPGAISATRAWTVVIGEVTSTGVGFAAEDGSEYSLLADIVDGELTSLVVAPGPDELFALLEDGEGGAGAEVAPQAVEFIDACTAIRDGWEALGANGTAPPDDLFVNSALARARLGQVLGGDMAILGRLRATSDHVGMASGLCDDDEVVVAGELAEAAEAERADLDRWACSVLDGAGLGTGHAGPRVLGDPLDPTRWPAYPAAEAEAFAALEWADWLGVVIEVTRSEPGTVVEPALMVDLVNRCPEVTSSIPRGDRPYYEWAFSMVLPVWIDAGVLDQSGALIPGGAEFLVGALRDRWCRPEGGSAGLSESAPGP